MTRNHQPPYTVVTVEDVAAVLVLIDRVPVAKLSTVVRVCAIGSSRPCRTDFVELAQWIASITYWRTDTASTTVVAMTTMVDGRVELQFQDFLNYCHIHILNGIDDSICKLLGCNTGSCASGHKHGLDARGGVGNR